MTSVQRVLSVSGGLTFGRGGEWESIGGIFPWGCANFWIAWSSSLTFFQILQGKFIEKVMFSLFYHTIEQSLQDKKQETLATNLG